MNSSLQFVLMFFVGLLGGLLGSSFMSTETSPVSPESFQAASAGNELEERLMAIESATDSLRSQFNLQANNIASLEDRLALEGTNNGPSEGGVAFGQMPAGQAFEGQINAVLEQRERSEELEREERRATRREEQLQKRVDRMAEELNLDPNQATQLAGIMSETTVSREDYFAELRELGTWDRDEIRETMEIMRADELEKVGMVLTPDQLGQYEEMTAWGNSGRGGGGNSGRGNSGRGNGGGRNNDF